MRSLRDLGDSYQHAPEVSFGRTCVTLVIVRSVHPPDDTMRSLRSACVATLSYGLIGICCWSGMSPRSIREA